MRGVWSMKCKKCGGHGVIPLVKGIRGVMKCNACGGSGEYEMSKATGKSNMKKAIIFGVYFEAPDELVDFCESIGYDKPNFSNDFDLMFDERVVEFCEQRLTPLWDEQVYRGRESCAFRSGFAGSGYIRDIDTSKTWILRYNNVDAPIIDYVGINADKYGHLFVV